MKKAVSHKTLSIAVGSLLLVLTGAAGVVAQSTGGGAGITTAANANVGNGDNLTAAVNATVGVHLTAAMTNAKGRADTEITNRINALTALLTRVQGMKNVSANNQATIVANIQSQISGLTTLKSTIDAETSKTALKSEIQSIVNSYRTYVLIIPQAVITAASDRIGTIVGLMTTLAAKLQARINAAQAGGTDVSGASAAFTDYQAKIADAQVQGQAAADEVLGLQPDNGSKTTFQANISALKDARSKIVTAQQDLKTARQDISAIVKNLPQQPSATTTSSTTATANPTGGGQ